MLKPRKETYERVLLQRLRSHIAQANEVVARDHNRRKLSPGSDMVCDNAFAYDFGSLRSTVEMITATVDELFGPATK